MPIDTPGARSGKSRGPSRRGARLSRLAAAISETGTNIVVAGRRAGIYKESARYMFKKRMLGRGFTLHATVAYERVGLRCVVLLVRVHKRFEERAEAMFAAMHESCFVESFSRTVPSGYYFVTAAVPEEHVAAFVDLANALEKAGIFSSLRIFSSEWRRDIPMRVENYDFERNEWTFDWEHPKVALGGALEKSRSRKAMVDNQDLDIINQLQLDATTTIGSVANELGVDHKPLRYHYRRHILAQGLIGKFRWDWSKVAKNNGSGDSPPGGRVHLGLNILAEGLDRGQILEIRAYFSQFPFLVLEAGGETFYYAVGEFPVESIWQAYEVMDKISERMGYKLEVFVRDPAHAALYGIPIGLFWGRRLLDPFDGRKVQARLETLLRRSGSS